jgi:two-component system chemotaxis sensor kinase CheA
MSIDLTEIRELFLEESFDSIDLMESNLLELENGNVNQEIIDGIFRGAHSIKGGAGIFHLEEIIHFAHLMETLLDEIRKKERIITQSMIDLLLRSVDALRMMLSALQEDNDYDEEEIQACQNALKMPRQENMIDEPAETSELTTPVKLMASVAEPLQTDNTQPPLTKDKGWHIVFKPDLSMLKTGNDPINLFNELVCLGNLEVSVDTSQVPTFSDLDVQACYFSWQLTLYADVERHVIEEIFEWVEDECELHITALESPSPLPPSTPSHADVFDKNEESKISRDTPLLDGENAVFDKGEDSKTASSAAQIKESVFDEEKYNAHSEKGKEIFQDCSPDEHTKPSYHHATETNSIRVSIDKIDDLINMVGELVITQSMLDQFKDNFDSPRISQLREGLLQLERNSRELQESVMRIRMLPISFSFNRFPRLIHDLSLQLGKKVELKLSGEQTELDKIVLEKINDPLVHLVRNALDHGIESPAQRLHAGKSEQGFLHLHAFHQGSNIIIKISDDGAGFDLEKIRAKAIQQGLLNAEEHPNEEQLYEFIFHPGFSTVTQVNNLSGRGVGMDVVRRNIRALSGTIEVQSKKGQGSTFSIRLPLTLAILDGQLVRVGQEIYILSLLSIIESLRINGALVNSYAGTTEVYRLRDEYIPILRLYDLFGMTPGTTQLEQGILVIVEGDGKKMGLFVDELLSQQQIVIKSLEKNYKKIQGISGATILGDGSVALILDVAGLIQRFHAKTIDIFKE